MKLPACRPVSLQFKLNKIQAKQVKKKAKQSVLALSIRSQSSQCSFHLDRKKESHQISTDNIPVTCQKNKVGGSIALFSTVS